jgi:enamine deaminase RidA (YjgF/YER057c/UK114 family)
MAPGSDFLVQVSEFGRSRLECPKNAGMDVSDIVKVTSYLKREEDISAYIEVRKRYLGAARPAFMLLVTPRLIRPEVLVEVEVTAAKNDQRRSAG